MVEQKIIIGHNLHQGRRGLFEAEIVNIIIVLTIGFALKTVLLDA